MRSTEQITLIKPVSNNDISISELLKYKELLYFFSWRDIKIRYKQTALGVGWAVIQPLIAAGIFTLFFNRVAKIPSGSANIPYPVMAYLAMTFWNCFSGTLTTVSNSILASQGIITKIYFPRLIPPLSATALGIMDFIFAIIIFFFLLLFYGILPHPFGVLFIIPSLLLIIVASLGVGLFFAALNVKYRDIRSALPFIIQIGFFITPVIYPLSMIPQKYQIYAFINPATGAISSIKSAMFGGQVNWYGLGISWIVALMFLAFGLWYFRKTEDNFVDII